MSRCRVTVGVCSSGGSSRHHQIWSRKNERERSHACLGEFFSKSKVS